MKKFKLSIIIISVLFILISSVVLVFVFNNPSEKKEMSDERKLTMELLGRISSQEDFSDPLGVFNENGEELMETDLTILGKEGGITNVTKYEMLKDVNGKDVKVKLKKQLTTEKNGEKYEGWIIDERVQGTIKYYLGKIKEISEKKIIFVVEKESKEMDFYTDKLVYEEVKDYEKTINLDEFKNNECEHMFIPPNDIYIGFKIMNSIDDFKDYFNKKIYLQETLLTYYKNSPSSKQIFFSEYF
jgi:hypothetical protein